MSHKYFYLKRKRALYKENNVVNMIYSSVSVYKRILIFFNICFSNFTF